MSREFDVVTLTGDEYDEQTVMDYARDCFVWSPADSCDWEG